jgi:hypothetical protein
MQLLCTQYHHESNIMHYKRIEMHTNPIHIPWYSYYSRDIIQIGLLYI